MKKDSMINTGSKNVFRLFIGSSTSTPSQKSSTVVSKVNSDEKRPFSSLSYQRNALKSIGEVNHQFIDPHNSATKNHVENPSLKPSGLSNLLLSEPKFNIDISQIIYMNSEIEERIDGRLRKEALMDLLSLHQAFYSLDSITFAKAICLLDSFISKIKFKPRYIMCVSAACYYMASKFDNSTDALHPTRENLIRLYRCPGTKNDLSLMIEIILNKLSDEFITSVGATNATSVNFLEKFFEILNINNHKDSEGFNWLLKSFSRKLEYMLCIPSLTKYRPACQALSLLYGSCLDVKNSLEKVQSLTPLDVLNLAHSCQVDWADIEECYDTFIKQSKSDQVNHSGNHFFNNNSQNSNLAHSQFTGSPPIRWNLSKKTRISMHKIASVKPTLTTLIEDESERSKSEDEEGNDFIRSSELQKTDSLEKLSNNNYPINFQTEDDKSKSIINKKLIGNQKEIINPEYTNQPSPGLSSNSSPTEINQQNNLLTSTNDTITNHEVAKITQVVKISQKLTTSSEKITSAATIFTKSSINKKHSIIKANRRQRNQNLFKLHQTKEVQLANDSVYSQPNYPFCEEINDSIWGLLRPLLTA